MALLHSIMPTVVKFLLETLKMRHFFGKLALCAPFNLLNVEDINEQVSSAFSENKYEQLVFCLSLQ